MSTDLKIPARSALDEALDPELVARLRRPVVKPGIISPVIARRITDMVQYFSNRIPLLEEILLRRGAKGALRHDDMPVVHAEPPREPAPPAAPATVAAHEPPKARVIVMPTEKIVERAAPSVIERVIDRAAPPAADLGRTPAAPPADGTITSVMVPTPAPAATPVIQVNPTVAATPAAPTPVIEANPPAAATAVIQANPAGATPLVMLAPPEAAGEPHAVNKDGADDEAPPRPVTTPEGRAAPREPLPQVAPAAAGNEESAARAPARGEVTYGPDGTPQIHSLRRAAAEALTGRPKKAAEGEPSAAAKARMPAFTIMPRAQRASHDQRRREMGLPPALPAQSAEAGGPPSPAGKGAQRPAAIDAPLFSEKPVIRPGREIAQSEPAPRPRVEIAPAARAADMPAAVHEVIANPGRRKDLAAHQDASAARVPVIRPSRRAGPQGAESPAPLVSVRPSAPAWSPSSAAATPARSPNERPRVKPEPLSTPAGEAMQELLPKRGASPVSPLSRANPNKETAVVAMASAAMAPAARDPLPPAASEVSTARIGQLVAAQAEGLAGASTAPAMTSAASRLIASPPAPTVDPSRAPPQSAPTASSAARPGVALSSIDMNALASQVQRKILRNLAVERARKGGVR